MFEDQNAPGLDSAGGNSGSLLYDAAIGSSGGKDNVLVLSGNYEPHTYNEYDYGELQLAGASVVTIGRKESLNNHDPFTISCFARMTGKDSGTLFSVNWRSGHTGHYHRIYTENGVSYLQTWWVEWSSNINHQFSTALGPSHNFSDWNHYVIVKSGSDWKHFVNGVLVGSHTHLGSSPGIDPYEQPNHEGFGETSIGGVPGINPEWMNINRAPHIRYQENAWWDTLEGAVDNLIMWNAELSQSDISDLYSYGGLTQDPNAPYDDWTHGGMISNIASFSSGKDSSGKQAYVYLKKDGENTTIHLTPDVSKFYLFKTHDHNATGISGSPILCVSGKDGWFFIYTNSQKLYGLTVGENSSSFSVIEFDGLHDLSTMRTDENETLILCYNDGKIKTRSGMTAMDVVSEKIDLSTEYNPGEYAVDVAKGDDGWYIISKDSSGSFRSTIALPDWSVKYKGAQVTTPINPFDVNYFSNTGKWYAAGNAGIHSADNLSDWYSE